MSKHTKEPWAIGGEESVMPHTCNMQIVGHIETGEPFVLAAFNYNFPDISVDAAARAVACVNAMAGIDDPEAFVKRAKRIEAAARQIVNLSTARSDGGCDFIGNTTTLRTALETNP
jgi:hypothetical protein